MRGFGGIAGELSDVDSDGSVGEHPGQPLNPAERERRTPSSAAKGDEKRDRDHDRALVELTATGAPGRTDDITSETPSTGSLGRFTHARACYICKRRYVEVDAFYHALCPLCAEFNRAKRAVGADLTGRRALVTGGRAKIGQELVLMMLRDGAEVTVTTRFPTDAVKRFASHPDSPRWQSRLKIVGIDLRDPAQVLDLTHHVKESGPLDILVNNAAQTVRRPASAYQVLIDEENEQLPPNAIQVLDLRRRSAREMTSTPELFGGTAALRNDTDETSLHVTSPPAPQVDAGGLVPDTRSANSWSQSIEEIDPMEMLEVQLCNVTAPFLLVSQLRSALDAADARRKYVVNVTATEGQFSRKYKGAGHPHTNMAKAALNMLTRTSAAHFHKQGILMTSVDTGWVTDERPHESKVRQNAEGFRSPLDLIDGAARIYDPIVAGERGTDIYDCLLKNYTQVDW